MSIPQISLELAQSLAREDMSSWLSGIPHILNTISSPSTKIPFLLL